MISILQVLTHIVMRILDSQCIHRGSDVSVWLSGKDPHDFLSEEAEEVVLAVLDYSPVGEVCVEDIVVIPVDIVEADFTTSSSLSACCLSRACPLDSFLARFPLRVPDFNRPITLFSIASLHAVAGLVPDGLVSLLLVPVSSVTIEYKPLFHRSVGAAAPSPTTLRPTEEAKGQYQSGCYNRRSPHVCN